MVFPSIRCLTCKSRRVKCDASRPNCARCFKAGRNCVWEGSSSSEGDIPFKSENAFAKGQPRRPRKPKGQAEQLCCNISTNSLSWVKPMFSPDIYAFQYWKVNLASWPDELLDIGQEYGTSAYYLCHYGEDSGSSLGLAVSAFSLAVYGRAKRSYEAIQRAEVFYAQSITQLRRELRRLSNDTIDQLLIATMMLSTYVNMMYKVKRGLKEKMLISSKQKNDTLLEMPAYHHNGTASLLQVRQQRGYSQNTNLDRALRRPIIRACLGLGVPVQGWLQDNSPPQGNEDPVLSLDSLMMSAASFQFRSIQILKQMEVGLSNDLVELEAIIAEAQLLDYCFAAWARDLPQEWCFSTQKILYPSGSMLENDNYHTSYDSFFCSYRTHSHAAIWNRYRATRLLINDIQLQLLTAMDRHTSMQSNSVVFNQSKACREVIDCLATELCRSIPFFCQSSLELIDKTSTVEPELTSRMMTCSRSEITPMMAVLLAWPLSTAIGVKALSSNQREWLKYRLKAVNGVLGSPTIESSM